MVGAAFSGIGMALIAYTLYLQQATLEVQRAELKSNTEALNAQKDEMALQVKAMMLQAESLRQSNTNGLFFELWKQYSAACGDLPSCAMKAPGRKGAPDTYKVEWRKVLGRGAIPHISALLLKTGELSDRGKAEAMQDEILDRIDHYLTIPDALMVLVLEPGNMTHLALMKRLQTDSEAKLLFALVMVDRDHPRTGRLRRFEIADRTETLELA